MIDGFEHQGEAASTRIDTRNIEELVKISRILHLINETEEVELSSWNIR